jgi:signal transduction histidine kinase
MTNNESRRVFDELVALRRATPDHAAFLTGLGDFLTTLACDESIDAEAGASPGMNAALTLMQVFAQAQLAPLHSGILHDVGGFMQSILLAADSIATSLRDLEGETSEDRRLLALRQAAEVVQESARLGRDVLRNGLCLGRAESGRAERITVAWAVNSALALLRWRDVNLELDPILPELEVRVPPAQFRRVLFNLLVNAREATRHTAQPAVDVRACLRRGEVYIEIADNGVGVTPAHLEAIFQPFFTTKPGGAGLGLFICKRLVQSWQGQLGCRSADNGRTVFWLTIPAAGERTGEVPCVTAMQVQHI